jgi:DNA-binding ferritin-like protein
MPNTRKRSHKLQGRSQKTQTRSQKRKSLQSKRKSHYLNKSPTLKQKSHIVAIFLEMINMVKLYHWKTRSYAQHKATDELYENLNEHVDTFIETLLGKDDSRIQFIEKEIRVLDESQTNDFKTRIHEYRAFLINMNQYFDSRKDSDLLNIRDEILGNINQFLYLLTFDK